MQEIPTLKWVKFITNHGCKYSRTSGSHDIYHKAGLKRPIVFRGNTKYIPIDHIKSNLSTLGISFKDFLEEIKGL
jgi:predicted RNA binding protein YcfA (HicA-like mRNA interferase family)